MSAERKARRSMAIRQRKASNTRLKELQRKEDRDLLAKKDLEIHYLTALLSRAVKDIERVRESRARLVKLVRNFDAVCDHHADLLNTALIELDAARAVTA